MIYKVILAVAMLAVTACHREAGPMERAGERVDEVGENISEGRNPLRRKGPLERAGESIDEATDGDGR